MESGSSKPAAKRRAGKTAAAAETVSETVPDATPSPAIVEAHEEAVQTGIAAHAPARSGLPAEMLYFDPAWYREAYADVAASGVDPVQHYMTFGYLEGRNPNALFSSHLYLEANPDLANGGINPFLHFVLHGAAEGRPTKP